MIKLRKLITVLLYFFLFILPFQTRWIYGPGVSNSGMWEYGARSLYASELLLGLILILSIIFFLIKIFKKKINFSKDKLKWWRLLALFLVIILLIINAFFAINSGLAFYKLTLVISAAALFFLIVYLPLEFGKISWILVLSGSLQSIIALSQFISQKVVANKWLGMASQDPQTLGVPVVETASGRVLRAFGSLPHPNMLAGFLVLTLILLIGLFILNKSGKTKKLLPLLLISNSIGLCVTLSRTALLAAPLSIVLIAFFFRKNPVPTKIISKLALIVIFVLLAFSLTYPELILTRLDSSNRLEAISNSERISQYSDAWQIGKTNWALGVGSQNYTVALQRLKPNLESWQYQPIHNVYVLTLIEFGLFGALMLILYLRFFIKSIAKSAGTNNQQLISLVCLIVFSFLGLFDHYLLSFYFGLILLVVIFSLLQLKPHGEQN